MINARLVICHLCSSYYSDPRQIPCSHSFCLDCLIGRFNEKTCSLECPKCDKIHEYSSINELQNRCMRDGFLAGMVAQFKRNQIRQSATPVDLGSRPTSTLPNTIRTNMFTPISNVTVQDTIKLNGPDPTDSERSSPSVSQQTRKHVLFAKCQSCNIRDELVVCDHCENVICKKCSDNHHKEAVNSEVMRKWEECKSRFEKLNEQSIHFGAVEEQIVVKARELQKSINKQSEELRVNIETEKNSYVGVLEACRRNYKQSSAHEEIIDEYESIDKRINELLNSSKISEEKVNDFLFEIQHLEGRLDAVNEMLDSNKLKFPVLTLPRRLDNLSFYGELEFIDFNQRSGLNDNKMIESQSNTEIKSMEADKDNKSIISDLYNTNQMKRKALNRIERPSLASSIFNAQKKQLLWQIEYFSVPYYVRIYENQLFICDKYGSLAVYKLSDIRQKPTLIREVKLFKDYLMPQSNSDEDQTIIDSFVVYKLWIIVFRRKKNELTGTIFLFTHDGKSISNSKFSHQYPSRELTIDTETNRLWSLDQKQLSLFYYDLPPTKSTNPDEYFQTRFSHVQFSKPFAPIHISVNKNVVAVLDKNRQTVHVYDKKTREELDQHMNMYGNSTHVCWDMALFSDNSLLIKLDETNSLRAGPSKHIYFQLDSTKEHNVIGCIEETDAYGMMITQTDEILIGIRINTKGIIKCYT